MLNTDRCCLVLLVLPLTLSLLLAACSGREGVKTPAVAAETRVPVSVAGFDYLGVGNSSVGDGVAALLGEALVNSGHYRLVDAGATPDGGGAPALTIRGSITSFQPACTGSSLILVAPAQACVGLDVRLLDGSNGKALATRSIEGRSDAAAIPDLAAGALPQGLLPYAGQPMETALRSGVDAAAKAILAAGVAQ